VTTRFIEATTPNRKNYSVFFLVRAGLHGGDSPPASEVFGGLLASQVPISRRLGVPLSDAIWMLDLSTHEGMLFSPSWSGATLERRFLTHPIHVSPLYWPTMRALAADESTVWTRNQMIEHPYEDVIPQPGVLVDATGKPVRGLHEWSTRDILPVRFRNRLTEDPDGQSILTPDETGNIKPNDRPVW
jgi:hypothetical protein